MRALTYPRSSARALVSMSVNGMGGIPVVKSELIEDGCAFLMSTKGEVLKLVRLPFKFQHAPECLYCHGHLPDLADCPACLGIGTFTENERSAYLHGTAIQKSWEEWKRDLTEMRRIPPVTFRYGSDTEAASNVDHTCAAWVLSGRVMREEEAKKFVDRRLQDLL